jgi:hypothetical protein
VNDLLSLSSSFERRLSIKFEYFQMIDQCSSREEDGVRLFKPVQVM